MKRGGGTSDGHDWRATRIRFTRAGGDELLIVSLDDGRIVGLPLWLYPTLAEATNSERRSFELIAGGRGVRWPGLDLDLSVRGMLLGTPDATSAARRAAQRLKLRAYSRALTAATRWRRAG